MADTDIVESFNRGVKTGLQNHYSQVHVLLLAWAKNDIPGVDDEVRDLCGVFEKAYNFTSVKYFPIPVDGSQRRELNYELSSFIRSHSQTRESLIIVYYSGHCFPNKDGQAVWAALETPGPTLEWQEAQTLLFSATGDVLILLDCCNASLIARGSKHDGGRLELIAAAAKGVKTPVGSKSFSKALIRLLREHAEEGISSESLASRLREDRKVTETPVFHNFARSSPTSIFLQRLQPPESNNTFIQKPSGYLLFRASLSGDVTGLQLAEWLKTAPHKNIKAVSIEAVVSRARAMQGALKGGPFPPGSVFDKLSASAKKEISRALSGLNTVMTVAETHSRDATTNTGAEDEEMIKDALEQIQGAVSTVYAVVQTPLLLDADNVSSERPVKGTLHDSDDNIHGLMAAADVCSAIQIHDAVLLDGPSHYSFEISRDKISFVSPTQRGGGINQRRFKLGTIDGEPVIMETYKYKEALDHSGEPYPQALQQVGKITGLLRHPKQQGLHILPCLGFFRNRRLQELGLAFKPPSTFDSQSHSGVVTLLQLYKMHRIVPLGRRIHLAWALTTAIENFHRVGWVHKSIRSNNIAFTERPRTPPAPGTGPNEAAPVLDCFDLSNPLLFGFEYSRAGDDTTNFDEDHSQTNNLYRYPERWGRPSVRFEKYHDVYSLGVVLLEVALWKDIKSILKVSDEAHIIAADVKKALVDKCGKTLSHKVGGVLSHCILTCLEFNVRTKGMSQYEAHRYFQQNVTGLIGKAVGKV